MKYNDIRGLLKIMREHKNRTLINEQNNESNLDETTLESIKEKLPENIIIENAYLSENKKSLTLIGEILLLDVEFNMIIGLNMNESDCTVDLSKMTSSSTIYSVDEDFVTNMGKFEQLYVAYKDIQNYVLNNNILNINND